MAQVWVPLSALVLVLVLAAGAYPALGAPQKLDTSLIDIVKEEVEEWMQKGNPLFVNFPGRDGSPTVGWMFSLLSLWPFAFNADDVKFHLFTKRNESDTEGTQVSFDKQSLLDAGWDSSRQTRIIVHGFANYIGSPVNQKIKNAYLATGRYNVICVDWGSLCEAPFYVRARLNVSPTGKQVGKFIDFLLEERLTHPARVHVIGHSLGAHVAGIAAASTTQATLSRVTGLDPALPLFEITPNSGRLNKNVAKMVDVIHTSGGFLGFADPVGKVDFYPNGGEKQVGCGIDIVDVCSHSRSYLYFAESIREGRGFRSEYCSSESNAEDGECKSNLSGSMGDKLRYAELGTYYLRTANSPPFNES